MLFVVPMTLNANIDSVMLSCFNFQVNWWLPSYVSQELMFKGKINQIYGSPQWKTEDTVQTKQTVFNQKLFKGSVSRSPWQTENSAFWKIRS